MSWLILVLAVVASAAAAYTLGRKRAEGTELTGQSTSNPQERAEPRVSEQDFLHLVTQLPGSVVLVDAVCHVIAASRAARASGILRRGEALPEELLTVARTCVIDQDTSRSDISIRRIPHRKADWDLRITALPVGSDAALLLLDDLSQANRVNEVRRDFVANVSHELKTPVGAMSLLAEAIVAAKGDPETVAQFATSMQAETKRLTQLINDVIDLSRLQGEDPLDNPQEVSIETTVANALQSVASHAKAKDIRILTSVEEDTWVRGDPEQLETALTNLLTNAISYSDDATTLAVVGRLTASAVEIDVKDQGIGIPENELDRVFERFYRVDEARSRVTGGTGLGLAIVRNVCENHGGEVSAWSVVGEGSTFRMRLPIPAEMDEALNRTEADDPGVGQGRVWTDSQRTSDSTLQELM